LRDIMIQQPDHWLVRNPYLDLSCAYHDVLPLKMTQLPVEDVRI